MANKGLSATLGNVAKNTGGTHAGIDPAGGHIADSASQQGSSGNPGLVPAWEGSDATVRSVNEALPPLKSL